MHAKSAGLRLILGGAGKLHYLLRMTKYIFAVIIGFIVISHIFLWRSEMAPGLKLTFTIINAVGWTIVFAPILLVDKWLASIKARNTETSNDL